MKKFGFIRPFLSGSAIALGMLIVAMPPVYAARLVATLFTGFSASSGSSDGPSGMETLNTTLQNTFGGNPNMPFSSQVFSWTEAQAAFNFINGFNDICCLVLIGHSFGGDTAIDDLATDLLLPNNRMVDLTIQIDSVGNGDEQLPRNVKMGINYYQISTGSFEPQGEQNVMGAMNINVEQLFNDNTITHTSIDDNPRLHQLIVSNISTKCVPEPASTLSLLALGIGSAASTLKRKQKSSKSTINRKGIEKS